MTFTGNSLSKNFKYNKKETITPLIISKLNNTLTGDASPSDFSDNDLFLSSKMNQWTHSSLTQELMEIKLQNHIQYLYKLKLTTTIFVTKLAN